MNIVPKIIEFITKNGWVLVEENEVESCIPEVLPDESDDMEFQSFIKQDNIEIDISSNEIVLLDNTGDFLHIQINKDAVYTLLGYLLNGKYLAIDYKGLTK